MVRVYKYSLALTSRAQEVHMPAGATVVHVHNQADQPALWAVVDPSAEVEVRVFAVFATGEDVSEGWSYVGTVHVSWTVWHVFERERR